MYISRTIPRTEPLLYNVMAHCLTYKSHSEDAVLPVNRSAA